MVITRQVEALDAPASELGSEGQSASGLSFGKILMTLRKSAGLTQTDLAKQLGVTQSYIANIETGNKRATDKFIQDVAAHLEAKPDRLQRVRDISSVAAGILIPGLPLLEFVRGLRASIHLKSELTEDAEIQHEKEWSSSHLFYFPKWPIVDEKRNIRRKAIADALADLTESELQRVQDFIAGMSSAARSGTH